MKVALVSAASLPATQFGGTLFLCVDIARELSKKGVKITIYTTDLDFAKDVNHFNKNLPRVEKVDNFIIKRTHVFFSLKFFLITPGMYNQIKNDKPDIIHSVGIRGFHAIVATLLSKFHKIPLVVSDQGGLYTHPNYTSGLKRIIYKIQEPIIKFIIGHANKIIVANDYEYSIFTKYCDSDKLVMINNGIDFDKLQECPFDFKRKYGIRGKAILFLGRFTKVKGIDLLIKAFSEIINDLEFKDVKLIIMGADFGYRIEMLKKINEFKINDQVIIIEGPTRDEVISAYHGCDFLVLPSRWEMSPITPLEGFSCKKPTISTRIYGIPNVIKDQKNGLLFETENVKDLKNKIISLLQDHEKVLRLGEAGYDFVKNNCTSNIMSEQVFKVYQNVLDENKQ